MASRPDQLPQVHEAFLPRDHALHRPRHGGRQLTALISALVFFLAPTALWLVGVRTGEIENHKVAGFPSLSRGWGFFTDLPQWATDQLSFRESAIAAEDGISHGLFGEDPPLDNGKTPPAGPLAGSPIPPPAGPADQTPSSDGQPGYSKVVRGSDGWLYYGYDAEAKCFPTRQITETVAKINELRAAVEQSGRKFILVVPPDKSTMVPQFLPPDYPGKSCAEAAIAPAWSQIVGAAGGVDLRPGLQAAAAQAGHPIYPAADTHWADEGALAMTRAIADAVQPGVTRTWTGEPVGQYSTPADLSLLINRPVTKTNVMYSLRPDGVVDRTGQFGETIDQPVHKRSAPLTGTVDRPTLIYGDSFTAASSRYLPSAFTNLTMLAYSTQKTPQQKAVDEFVNAQVVVVEAVERNVSGGQLAFTDEGFIQAVRTALAQHPIG